MPGRSPGTLGRNDAGDPDARMCMAADTPGTVGTGGDLAMSLLPQERLSCEMPIQVIEVDLGKMRRFLYTVAYAEAANAATTRGFASTEIDTGNQMQVEAAARTGAENPMDVLPPAPAALGIGQILKNDDGSIRGYTFRLGCAHFPHLKLQATEHNDGSVCVFGVDTHDALPSTGALPPDHPDLATSHFNYGWFRHDTGH